MKQTEKDVLKGLKGGNQPGARDAARLLGKVGKDQSRGRARDIAAVVETEFEKNLAKLTPGDQVIVKRAVGDYTQASDTINTSCRNGKPDAAALNLDKAFEICEGKGFTNQQRVVYRLMTYKPPTVCPYGAAAGKPRIVPGDLIRDLGFFSTSEHRQFLVNGILNPPPGSRYVKFVIVGKGGMNISGGAYTNANEQRFLEQKYKKTHMFRTAEAGQAEVLFPRGTVLRVESLSNVGHDVHVFATIPSPQPTGAGVKNSFTGS